jgi:hypothetical protein
MKPCHWIALPALILTTSSTFAQDLPTDQLDGHAEVVRQDMLLKSTVRRPQPPVGDSAKRATPQQAAACAKKAQFRSQYGADHPKVQKLFGLCRDVGL